jgi:hypothetical protein
LEMLASLARSEKVAGELARRRTAGIGGGSETLGHGGSLHAREIGRGGEVRRPAAEAEGQRRGWARTHMREVGRSRWSAAYGQGRLERRVGDS